MNDSIVPATRIGKYYIGWTFEKLVENLTDSFIQVDLDQHITLQAENIKVWISKLNNKVTQIMAYNNFKGKFLNKIGIGNCLEDIVRLGIRYKQNDYIYELPDFPGICFELEDIDDWNELIAPIRYISIFESESI